jgi:hypothetical protein
MLNTVISPHKIEGSCPKNEGTIRNDRSLGLASFFDLAFGLIPGRIGKLGKIGKQDN